MVLPEVSMAALQQEDINHSIQKFNLIRMKNQKKLKLIEKKIFSLSHPLEYTNLEKAILLIFKFKKYS